MQVLGELLKAAGFDLQNKHPKKALRKIASLLMGCLWAAAMVVKGPRIVSGGIFAGIVCVSVLRLRVGFVLALV